MSSKEKDPRDSEDKEDDDDDDKEDEIHEAEKDVIDYNRELEGNEGNPLVLTLFEFLTEPRSSRAATYWGALLAILFVLRVVLIALESCDGPNQFIGIENRARYKFLFTDSQYYLLYICNLVPIVIDAILRFILLMIIMFSMENRGLKRKLISDKFTLIMCIMDIIGVMSFFMVVLYLRPNNIRWEDTGRLMLRIVELCGSVKVLRIVKDVAGIFAIRKALGSSFPHLKVPVYFFFTFNITVAVFLYFLEPCYNVATCPWKNLFDVSFYSVVTMTTTGYGNQVPYSLTGRLFGCFVMLFGALFMSMPLAIIGNNYADEWAKVKEMQRKSELAEEKANQKAKSNWSKVVPFAIVATTKAGGDKALQDMVAKEKEEQDKLDYKLIHDSPLITLFKTLTILVEKLLNDISHSFRLNPSILSGVCELRGMISNVLILIRNSIFACEGLKKSLLPSENYESGRARLKLIDPNIKFLTDDLKGGTKEKDNEGEGAAKLTLRSVVNKVEKNISAEKKTAQMILTINSKSRNRLANAGFFVASSINKKSIKSWFTGFFGSDENAEARVLEEHEEKLREVTENPTYLRNRLWVLLELPDSSKLARVIHVTLILTIVISVFVLYTETMVSLNQYGEVMPICHNLIHTYCENKHDPDLDPGCFVHDESYQVTSNRLRFYCQNDDCVGYGTNFGAVGTNITCSNTENSPFQDLYSLWYHFGKPQFLWSRSWSHKINPICTRIECINNELLSQNAGLLWNSWEIVSNVIFLLEAVLRIIISKEVFNTCILLGGSFNDLNFAILASSPDKVVVVVLRSLKILRLFKLSRSFSDTKVLTGTAQKAWKQMLGIISFLIFLVTVFAILLYEVEKGTPCFYGDEDCPVPTDAQAYLRIGAKVYLNKNGGLSNFSNVLYSLWFSFVTLTTTGYGDFVPVTNVGLLMAIFIMLAGSFYMAMPLTAAASVFYREHISHNKRENTNEKKEVIKEEALDDLTKNILILQSELMDSELKLKDYITILRSKAVPGNGVINENITTYDQTEELKLVNINILKGYDRDGSNKDASKLISKIRAVVEAVDHLLELHKQNIKKLAIVSAKAQLEQIENLLAANT